MKCRLSRVPSGFTRLMKPLLSLTDGLPLMFETKYMSVVASHSTDSGVCNESTVATLVAPAGALAAGLHAAASATPKPMVTMRFMLRSSSGELPDFQPRAVDERQQQPVALGVVPDVG